MNEEWKPTSEELAAIKVRLWELGYLRLEEKPTDQEFEMARTFCRQRDLALSESRWANPS